MILVNVKFGFDIEMRHYINVSPDPSRSLEVSRNTVWKSGPQAIFGGEAARNNTSFQKFGLIKKLE